MARRPASRLRWALGLLVALSVLGVGRPRPPSNKTLDGQLAAMKAANETCADRGLSECLYPALFGQTLDLPIEVKQQLLTASRPSAEPRLECSSEATRPADNVSSRVYPRTNGTLTELLRKHNHTYLVIAVPPHWGSTGLEGLIASSPHVSNMCGANTWACEGTWLLSKAGLFDSSTRWLENVTDWDAAFRIYHEQAWNMSSHFLMDKSPPNSAKIAELVQYFESHGMNYFFITMGRHPCYFNHAHHANYYTKAKMLQLNYPFVPPERRIHILYEEAMLAPQLVTQRIVDRIPELKYLDFGINGLAEVMEENRENNLRERKKQGKDDSNSTRQQRDRKPDIFAGLSVEELQAYRQHLRDQQRESGGGTANDAAVRERQPAQRVRGQGARAAAPDNKHGGEAHRDSTPRQQNSSSGRTAGLSAEDAVALLQQLHHDRGQQPRKGGVATASQRDRGARQPSLSQLRAQMEQELRTQTSRGKQREGEAPAKVAAVDEDAEQAREAKLVLRDQQREQEASGRTAKTASPRAERGPSTPRLHMKSTALPGNNNSAAAADGADPRQGRGLVQDPDNASRSLQARTNSWFEYTIGKECYFMRKTPCFDPAVAAYLGYVDAPSSA